MSDLIDRQAAIEAIRELCEYYTPTKSVTHSHMDFVIEQLEELPSAQPEQTQMIKEIRKWISSGNRGSADYFIVDKIEEIINKYERGEE